MVEPTFSGEPWSAIMFDYTPRPPIRVAKSLKHVRWHWHWLRDKQPIPGARAKSYVLQPEDEGRQISFAFTSKQEA